MANDLTTSFHFSITDIQAVTLPLPSNILTLDSNRRFFVSVTDGKITKDTRAALQPLHWGQSLDGFMVESTSQITLKVFEKHSFRKDNLLATFVIPYEALVSSRNRIVQSVDNSKKKKTPSHQINITWSERPLIPEPDTNIVEEIHSHLQTTKEDALRMKKAGVAVKIVGVSNSVGQVLQTAGKVIPSIEFLAKCSTVRDQLDFVVRAVDAIAGVHPYAKIAWSVISFIPMKISEQIHLDREVFDMLDEIAVALDLAPDADTLSSRCQKSDRHEKTLARLLEQITECGHFIQSYIKDVNFGKRMLRHLVGDGSSVVDNFRRRLKKLREDFVSDVIVTVETNIFRILGEAESISEDVKALGKGINEVDLDVKLQNLPYGQGTNFDPERGCLPHTRVKILDEITGWVNDPSSLQVLLLFGQAGTGKSSIAHEMARRFRSVNRLTTSYCFVRGKPSSRDCYRFFTTLTHNLCNQYPAFRDVLNKIITDNPGLVEMQANTTLFESLLRDPLKQISFVGPVFIVVDALDESEDASEMRRQDTLAFHDFLATRLGELPPNFRILITSRPEPDLERAFSEPSFVRRMYMNDPKLTVGLDDDILTYMRTKLSKVKGVTEDDLERLAKKSEGNFQWAFVACSHIIRPPSGLDFRRCIQRVLQPNVGNPAMALNPLDELYVTILKRFDMNDRDVRDTFKSVMGQILGAFEPLSVDVLDAFASKDDLTNVSAFVDDLGSLLSHVTSPESALPIAPLHTSFRDFLTNRSRSGDFHVNLDDAHQELALATLRTMQQDLKFNICKLETSYLLNKDVPDLKKRVEDNIPLALSYSCRFWARHLAHVRRFESNMFESLQAFMTERLLFWLEVLSVRSEVEVAKPALLSLRRWLHQVHDKVKIEEIDALAEDAIAFVHYFGCPIARSAPHIYVSALPFSPSSSVISKLYMPRFSTLQLKTGRLTKWSALEMTLPRSGKGRVRCVAWSRDGEYIAAGVDSDITVFSTSTGMRVSGPFRVEDRLASIAFSHDGQRLAAGLWEGNILIMSVMNEKKTKVRGPWTPVGVSAVAFSEGGRKLVVGLFDGRVWLWDLEMAETVGGPFIGHNNSVWEVSFLDQEHLVARSGFRTVRVWNVETRASVTRMGVATGTIDSAVHQAKYFIHDPSRVKSGFRVCSWSQAVEGEERHNSAEGKWGEWFPIVAFSPDGKFVATCDRHRVHVWFAMGGMAGTLAGGPFSSEDGLCLAFSTDGRRVASGTADGSLRVWNVQLVDEDEASIRRPPWSVAFMPDGEQIVVGWKDGRVEVLDASTGQAMVKVTAEDNQDHWTLVAVSPDGNRIVSARDKEMRIWTRTGKAVVGPLKSSDDNLFWSVAFSPDSNDLVAYGTRLGTVCVLNASTADMIACPKKFNSFVTALALSPSISSGSTMAGTRVAVGAQEKIYVWNTLTGNVVGPFTLHHTIHVLAFSSDGKFITSVADDYTLCVWDSFSGKTMRGPVEFPDLQSVIFDNHPSLSTRRIALSPDGRRAAFTGINNTILLFDILYNGDSDVDLHRSSILSGHIHALNSFAFSRDGQYLATPSNDRTIKIWDLHAALEHKEGLENSASNNAEVFNLDETWIDDNGWAAWAHEDASGNTSLRWLAWVPEIHRDGLYRPSITCLVGGRKETRLDLENFVHGKNWVRCWLGPAFE